MNLPILYSAELNFPDDQLAEFRQWFAHRHAPDLFRAGFRNATCYSPLAGGMNVMDLYEAADIGIFTSDAYRDVRLTDPHNKRVLRDIDRVPKHYTIYAQRALRAPAGGLPLLGADRLTMIRFNAPKATADAAASWWAGEEGARLAGIGATAIRFGERLKDPRDVPGDRPHWIAIVEWSGAPAELGPAIAARFGAALADLDLYPARRRYPWPNSGDG